MEYWDGSAFSRYKHAKSDVETLSNVVSTFYGLYNSIHMDYFSIGADNVDNTKSLAFSIRLSDSSTIDCGTLSSTVFDA